MKKLLFLGYLLISSMLFSQSFTEVLPPPQLNNEGVHFGTVNFADVDGDNDQDVLITGENSSNVAISILYTNDGQGIFSKVTNTPFRGVSAGSVAFADVDGDNDQDVLLVSSSFAILYTNDGLGHFTKMEGTPFVGRSFSSVAFADLDGDNDQDVIITGEMEDGSKRASLYSNNGQGIFKDEGHPFEGVSRGALAFADVNGDGYQDVLLAGKDDWEWWTENWPEPEKSRRVTRLYINLGQGGLGFRATAQGYSGMSTTPFEGVDQSAIAFADVDGDTDQDVIITGMHSTLGPTASLYINDGQGIFSKVTNTPFEPVRVWGSVAFADVDGDDDKDVLITGNSSTDLIAKLYSNNGQGIFEEIVDTPFKGVVYSAVAFADVDRDNDQDVIITGLNNGSITELYTNDGNGDFIKPASFETVRTGSMAFSDVDLDGDPDILLTGENSNNSSYKKTAKLYTNEGNGIFTEVSDLPFEGVYRSSVAFADVDGDQYPDVLISGENQENERITRLYINQRDTYFSEVSTTPFEGVTQGSIAFADVDNDQDQDVLITGWSESYENIAKLYSNDGWGGFTEVSGTPFEGVYRSSMAFADVDGDEDPDILITGRNISNEVNAKLYTNDGTGNFSEVPGLSLEGVENGSIAFTDIDSDQDQDVLITGRNAAQESIAKLYTNDGTGNFSEVLNLPFEGVEYSTVTFCDVDNDQDQDVLITGRNISGEPISKLYTNDGAGNFSEVPGLPFDGVFHGSVAFADVDNDGYQDLFMTGATNLGESMAKLYINDGESVVVAVSSAPPLLDFHLFPNPVLAGQVQIQLKWEGNQPLNVSIYSLTGQLLQRHRLPLGTGEQTLFLNTSTLVKGVFIVQLDDGLRIGTQRLIVQ